MMDDKNKHSVDCCAHSHNHAHSHCDDGCGCRHNHADINKKDFLFKIITGGILFILGHIFSEIQNIPEYISLICFGLSYIIVGFNIVKEAVEGILRKEFFDENFLMTVASIGAFAIKEYSEGCAVMLLFTIGEFLQGLAVSKSKKSITSMLEKSRT